MSELEPWQWPEEVWRTIVEEVRAGRSLTPAAWPGGAKVAVAISFDSDHETPLLRDNQQTPGTLSTGEYGARVAVPRLLRLLDESGVKASFFVPAVSALLHPGEIDAYTAAGHEIGVHGWIHERNTLLSYENELDLIGRSLDTLEHLSGTRPAGIRTPSWDFSPSTLTVVRELGFAYDSSLMADDEPYEILAAGEPTGLVEIPVEWIRDDAVYFGMSRYAGLRPYTPPADVLELWKREFDGAYADGGLFQLTMHPSIIGHRSRIWILRELLSYIAGHDGVWTATHQQIADACLGKDRS
ncbi:polysaccharide deacetylase family protein [Kineosporia succinea]|uniref:Peptidoglycan/xylan/chitin deacetylase (PgdA/CDA1 family) n=1 Tax=Kineosporia succinea TaxID=84632 RepID=A0ABT9PA19_9ACTN|nr:polysaccharide deacetylase [Kineosporia succinea]MDP9829539.1 peptidoglycan/xylan/chitin deacetylase (PgdA/CDA1 family) [Kineosporia succinea]